MVEEQSYPVKRQFKRRELAVSTDVTARGIQTIGSGVEISENGMLLRSKERFERGQILEIGFRVPGGEYVKAAAEVLYQLEPNPGEFHFGLCFIDRTVILVLEVRRYINELK